MISIALTSLRVSAATAAPAGRLSNRHLSMACAQSVDKLKSILEEYRKSNYSQEYPKRFQKDIVKVASNITSRQLNSSPVNAVSAHGIEHVLHNIGAGHKMSRSEIQSIVSEVGACPIGKEDDCVITADQMLDLLSTKWAEHHHELNQ
ncbi:hypothetical protein HJC23_006226 [Cyclotella cryptica]|uniref:Uncharacterized protein n=1 Tax=Cyclotella cryptica TaxID=29204 RepID=A0ABD3PXM5_9STRA|eukprot:CCRYP_010866-RA/>CCRYP_010866-RA protein AED:0.39 eAED:0.39 QI:304/1/1/1/1/1/2/150/147